jgi:hypothetical protein
MENLNAATRGHILVYILAASLSAVIVEFIVAKEVTENHSCSNDVLLWRSLSWQYRI